MAVMLSDIVEGIAKATRLTRPESRVVADRILDFLASGLARGEDFEIRHFGTFRTRVVSGKVGRHLATGATVILPPMRKVSFRAGKFLKPVVAPADELVPPPVTPKLRTPERRLKSPGGVEKPAGSAPKSAESRVTGEQTSLPGV